VKYGIFPVKNSVFGEVCMKVNKKLTVIVALSLFCGALFCDKKENGKESAVR
jgi:hypothetical protein